MPLCVVGSAMPTPCLLKKYRRLPRNTHQTMFTSLDLVFFDTTSIYFEGKGGDSLGRRGFSKDPRPDLLQMVLGAVIDDKGQPICCEMRPGNTADLAPLLPVVERLKTRFAINRIRIVAHRGMIGKDTIAALETDDGPLAVDRQQRARPSFGTRPFSVSAKKPVFFFGEKRPRPLWKPRCRRYRRTPGN